jgi:hypothetical protein
MRVIQKFAKATAWHRYALAKGLRTERTWMHPPAAGEGAARSAWVSLSIFGIGGRRSKRAETGSMGISSPPLGERAV